MPGADEVYRRGAGERFEAAFALTAFDPVLILGDFDEYGEDMLQPLVLQAA